MRDGSKLPATRGEPARILPAARGTGNSARTQEIDLTGEALGNFPQAFTHLALISAAVNISRALDDRSSGSPDPLNGREPRL